MGISERLKTVAKQVWSNVPSGGSLPEAVWRSRCRFLLGLTWFHAAAIALAGPLLGHRWEVSLAALWDHGTVIHTALEGVAVAAFAAVAGWGPRNRTFQATAIGFGLMSASGVLVHLSGGYIEAHFHFFVMLPFLALFQDWIAFLLAVAFVAVHHGVVGVLWPHDVYNHPAAFAAPWRWAGIHAFFVLCACVGSVIAWRFNERARAQTALILEATGEGIFGLDTEGRITFMNPAAADMLHATPADLGRPIGDILHHLRTDGSPVPEDECSILAPMRDGRARRETDDVFARRDGSYIPVDHVSTPMIERNHLTGVVVSFQDITERKRSKAALERSHRQLEETLEQLKVTQQQVLQQERLRAVGQMASGIAHDFNNSLAPIVGFSELLLARSDDLTSRAHDYLKLINTAARDASAVVRRLRELYRDRGEPAPGAAVDLPGCIEEAVSLTQPRWKNQAQANGRTIQVVTDVAALPALAGDGTEIREMLTNLIFNAVDAMPDGGTITVRARPAGDRVRLEVADTGTGMSEEVRRRCMEPFFSTKGQQGTGLGLSLVHAIVERHRGTCAIESAPGRGTTFAVHLPVTAPAPAAETPLEREAANRRLRVLVVDDEPIVRRTITEQLISEGHTVDSAVNGADAIDKFLSGWFDVVITDRAMPEMGGDQLAAAIREHAPDKPVIMLTGFGDLMTARGERPAGVSVVISKPVTLADLRSAIAQATACPVAR
jgi:PAS domain S-box-containing protein